MASSPSGALRLIHVSDLHFHRAKQDNVQAEAALQAIARSIRDDPDAFLIVTGDITDDGAPEQYKQATAALRPFVPRVFVCPGNHDFGALGNFYDPERARRFDKMCAEEELRQGGTFKGSNLPVVNVVRSRDGVVSAMLIALDSNLETTSPFDFACGEIGAAQLAALETLLTDPASADLFKVVFLHHHPFVVGDPFISMLDARPFTRTLYGRVDVLAFGHKHESRMWRNVGGVDLVVASDNTPGKRFVRQVTLRQGQAPEVADLAVE